MSFPLPGATLWARSQELEFKRPPSFALALFLCILWTRFLEWIKYWASGGIKMKNILISVMTFLAATSVWACDYTIGLDAKVGATKICVDGVSFKQLNENYYRVTFSNYFPGTRISYQKVNFHFNGKKEFIEQDILALDKFLRTYPIGDLYFTYESGFSITLKSSDKMSQAEVKSLKLLMDEINSFVY